MVVSISLSRWLLSRRSPPCSPRAWRFGLAVKNCGHGPLFAERPSLSLCCPCYLARVSRLSAAASRNKYVVVGLGGATVRMSARLDSPVLKTLPQGMVRAVHADLLSGVRCARTHMYICTCFSLFSTPLSPRPARVGKAVSYVHAACTSISDRRTRKWPFSAGAQFLLVGYMKYIQQTYRM